MTTAQDDVARQRYNDLKGILQERRREILAQVQRRESDMRAESAEGANDELADVLDTEPSDIDLAIIAMKRETLLKLEQAEEKLEEGKFGDCFECGDEIAVRRLRALPFAVRCKDCEEAREFAQRRERVMSQRKP